MRRTLTAIALALGLLGGALSAAPATAVVNGSNATNNPGAVSIYTDNPNRNRCTGVLVEPEWVLTAAHCWQALHQPTVTEVEIRIGSTDNTTGYTSYGVVGYHWPADFDPETNRSDIMLIELDAAVPATVEVPAEWESYSPPVGSITTVYGWGWVCDGPPGLSCSTWYAGPLQRLALEKIADSNCTSLTDPRQTCHESASSAAANACLGDSGAGNFVVGLNGKIYVRELIVGDGDANGGSCLYGPDGTRGLALATDVGAYADWMQSVIN